MYVYFIKADCHPPLVKIGRSKDPKDRLGTIQTGCPHHCSIVALIRCKSEGHARHTERSLHRFFKSQRINGEWFRWTLRVEQLAQSWEQLSNAGFLEFARLTRKRGGEFWDNRGDGPKYARG